MNAVSPSTAYAVDAVLQQALETAPEGFALFDAEDRCVFWNARYGELWAKWGVTLTVGGGFESLLRAGLAAGRYPEAGDDPAGDAVSARQCRSATSRTSTTPKPMLGSAGMRPCSMLCTMTTLAE